MMMETLPPSTVVEHVGMVTGTVVATSLGSSPTSPSSSSTSSSSSSSSSESSPPQSSASVPTNDSPLPAGSFTSIDSVTSTSNVAVSSSASTTVFANQKSPNTTISMISTIIDSDETASITSINKLNDATTSTTALNSDDSSVEKNITTTASSSAVTTTNNSMITTTQTNVDISKVPISNGKSMPAVSSFIIPLTISESTQSNTSTVSSVPVVSSITTPGVINGANRLIPATSVVAAVQSSSSASSNKNNVNGSTTSPTSTQILSKVTIGPTGTNQQISIQQMAAAVASTTPTALPPPMITTQQAQKRPMNAFLIFCKRHRSVVRERYPHLENRSITKILGEWWAALKAEEKHDYTDLARQYKEAFMKANPHFKWYKTTEPPPPPPPSQTSSLSTQQSIPVQPVMVSYVSKPSPINSIPKQSSNETFNNLQTNNALTSIAPSSLSSSSSLVTVKPILDPKNNVQSSSNTIVGNAENKESNSSSSSDPTVLAISSHQNKNNSNNIGGGHTPKPPKKRYLESLESSNNDYAKKPNNNVAINSNNNGAINGANTNNNHHTIKDRNDDNDLLRSIMSSSSMNVTETASHVIEKQLMFGSKLGFGSKSGAKPISLNYDSNHLSMNTGTSTENTGGQSKFDNQTSSINGHDNCASELKAAKTMLAIASAASGVGSSALIAGNIDSNSIVEILNDSGKNKISSSHDRNLNQNDSDSETASDDEIANYNSTYKESQRSPERSYSGRSSHCGSETKTSSDPKTFDCFNSSTKNSNDTTGNAKIDQLSSPNSFVEQQDKPLNLSSSSSIEANEDKQTKERTITRSNQQIIDHYIDKFLSSGQLCDHKPMPPNLLSENHNNSNNIDSSNNNARLSSTTTSQGVLNLSTTIDGSTPTTETLATANNNSSSKFLLVAKDFSLRSITAAATANGSQAQSNKRSNSDSLIGSNNSSSSKNANSSPASNNGFKPRLSTNHNGLINPNEPSPSKRSRTNGTVIDVNEMMAAMASASTAAVTDQHNHSNESQSHSKFVTGSFDLEEHIRALPQLDNNHLVNSLQLRNHHGLTKSNNSVIGGGSNENGSLNSNSTLMILTTNNNSINNNNNNNIRNSSSSVPSSSASSMLTTQSNSVKTILYSSGSGSPILSSQHSLTTHPENMKINSKTISASKTSSPAAINLNSANRAAPPSSLINNVDLNMDALPLRLVAAATAGALPAGANVTTGSGQTASISPRLSVNPSVVIKLGTGQAIPVQTIDGNLVPLLIRAPTNVNGSPVNQPILMSTAQIAANPATAISNNKPIDLSVAVQSTATSSSSLSSSQSAPTSVIAESSSAAGLHHLAAVVRTTSPVINPQQSSYLTTQQTPMLLSISPESKISLPTSSINNGSNTMTLSSLSSSSSSTTNTGSSSSASTALAQSSGSLSSNLFSTVISSQGSINQCDGLAALAEIALQQANR
ncbi:Tetratricopeptide repeat protein 35 [Sarcoptes scabiei]|nr:Tetratricopeptide repeat protein 35 [Sarcoptes scabiei]